MGHGEATRREAALAWVERGSDETIEQLSLRVGVPESTLYRWLSSDESFIEMVRDFTDKALAKIQPEIDRAMIALATSAGSKGQVAAAKLISERGGRTEKGVRDKGLDDFLKKYEGEDKADLEHFVATGQWPEDELIADEPEEVM